MGCGQKAYAMEQEEIAQRKHDKECRALVKSFSPTNLGDLLYDIHKYLSYKFHNEKMTRHDNRELGKLIDRIKIKE